MDPDKLLEELRETVLSVLENPYETMSETMLLMAEQFQSLDVFLTSGGTLPKAWQERRKAQL